MRGIVRVGRILGHLPATAAAAAIALAATAPAGGAQELIYSPQATRSCLEEAPALGVDRRECIGRSAMACVEATEDGATTYGMGYCWERERADWDARLNRVYRHVREKARQTDREMREIGSAAPSVETALRDAQRAWIVWRDATCGFEMAQWGGGTGSGPALLACLTRLTGEQALYLEEAWMGE